MLILGVFSEELISKLFPAGIIPGLLICTGLMLVCYVSARQMGIARETKRATAAELWRAVREGGWALLAPVIILGGIYGGIFTPTEAGAVGVASGLVDGLYLYGDLRWRDLPAIFLDALRTTRPEEHPSELQ